MPVSDTDFELTDFWNTEKRATNCERNHNESLVRKGDPPSQRYYVPSFFLCSTLIHRDGAIDADIVYTPLSGLRVQYTLSRESTGCDLHLPGGEYGNNMDTGIEPKSKSQVKREMIALQAIGEKLVELSPDQISRIDMPGELREALLFARTITRGEARRRQLQYIGALMREVDTEPIEKALAIIGRGQHQDAEHFKQLERWRDDLMDGNDALMEDILARFPDTDRQKLRQLVFNARKERQEDKPPKSSRALFRFLKALTGR